MPVLPCLAMSYLVAGASAVLDLRLVPVVGLEDLGAGSVPASNAPGYMILAHIYHYYIIEGSLEAKLPTIWKDGNGTARKKLGRGES